MGYLDKVYGMDVNKVIKPEIIGSESYNYFLKESYNYLQNELKKHLYDNL